MIKQILITLLASILCVTGVFALEISVDELQSLLGNQNLGATYLFPSGGGTGTSTNPAFGNLLVGNNDGTYTLTATSSLGIAGSSYTAGGTLLDLTGTTFSVNEGTLTDTKYCTYEAGTGLECNSNASGFSTIAGINSSLSGETVASSSDVTDAVATHMAIIADTSTIGHLNDTDWDTFNGKWDYTEGVFDPYGQATSTKDWLLAQANTWTGDLNTFNQASTTMLTSSGNIYSDGYYYGQPLDGHLGSGIIWADRFDSNGNIGINHFEATAGQINYPNMKARLVTTGNEVTYCDITSATTTPQDEAHIVYYLGADCNVATTTYATYITTDISPGGVADLFTTVSHSGEVEIHLGAPLQNKVITKARKSALLNNNLKVIEGFGFTANTFPSFTVAAGKYNFIDTPVDTTEQVTATDYIENIYHTGGEWTYATSTGLQVSKCDNGTNLIDCTNTGKYRRHFIFVGGYQNSDDDTKLHYRNASETISYANIADCENIKANPITYDLPALYDDSLVLLYAYCAKPTDIAWDTSQLIDVRYAGASGSGASVDTSNFLTRDGTRALTANWNVGAYDITASTFIGALTGTASGNDVLGQATSTGNMILNGTSAFTDFNGNDIIDTDNLNWGNFTDLGEGGVVTWSNLASGELTSEVLIIGTDVKAGTLTDTKLCTWDAGNTQIVCNSDDAGVTSGSDNQILTDDGAGGITSESNMTFDGTNILTVGVDDTATGTIYIYGDDAIGGAILRMYNSANLDTTEEWWQFTADGDTSFNLGIDGTLDLFQFYNSGNLTVAGNLAGATYGSDASVSDTEMKYINSLSSNAQDQLDAKSASFSSIAGLNTLLPGETVASTTFTGFLSSTANDTMTGTLTCDGLTMGQDENLTLGSQTLDHDGTDFVFNDSLNITGEMDSTGTSTALVHGLTNNCGMKISTSTTGMEFGCY